MDSLEPGVPVSWLRRHRPVDSVSLATHRHRNLPQTELVVEDHAHLQGQVDLVLDVFDDVAFDPRVIAGFQHVPETRRAVKVTRGEEGHVSEGFR